MDGSLLYKKQMVKLSDVQKWESLLDNYHMALT